MLTEELFGEISAILEPSDNQVYETSYVEGVTGVGVEEFKFGGPLVIGVFRSWAIKKLLELGCQHKAEIKEAAIRAISQFVKNPFLQTLLMEVLSTAIYAICPVDPA